MWSIAWQTGFLPGIVGLICAFIAHLLRKQRWLAGVFLALGVMGALAAADNSIRGWSSWKPVDVTQRISPIGLALGLLAPTGMWIARKSGWAGFSIVTLIAAAIAGGIAYGTKIQSDSQVLVAQLAAVLAFAWLTSKLSCRASTDFVPILALCIAAFGVGGICAWTGSASLGQLSIALGAALMGVLIIRVFSRDLEIAAALIPAVTVLLLIILFAQRFSELPMNAAFVLAALPALGLVRFIPGIGTTSFRYAFALVLLVAIDLGTAAAFIKMQQKPVEKTTEPDPYEKFYSS